jgi:hypothetical protein
LPFSAGEKEVVPQPLSWSSETAGDRSKDNTFHQKGDTSHQEVHAEGHFLQGFSTLKMLLSGYLDEEKMILADRRIRYAKFFLFQEGKFLGKNVKILLDDEAFRLQGCKAQTP